MRDKNLTHIQLSESIDKYLDLNLDLPISLTTTVVDSPTLLESSDWNFRYPRKFEELRGLICVTWFLQNEFLKWRILGDLLEKNFTWLNRKQQIEISILLSSKFTCIEFLRRTRRFSSHEFFGNILYSGCRSLRNLRISRVPKRPIQKTQRKRGYDDKGSRRKTEDWIERFDIGFTLEQNRREKIRTLQLKHIHSIIKQLENTENSG